MITPKQMHLATLFVAIWTSSGMSQNAQLTAGAQSPLLADIRYKDACGPISCLFALTSVGVDTTLSTVSSKCKWTDGETVSFEDVFKAVSSYDDVRARLVRITPDALTTYLTTPCRVAILPIRKNADQLNHTICVYNSAEGELTCFDYPQLEFKVSMDSLIRVWDGEAVLIEKGRPIFGQVERNLLYCGCLTPWIAWVCTVLVRKRFVNKKGDLR